MTAPSCEAPVPALSARTAESPPRVLLPQLPLPLPLPQLLTMPWHGAVGPSAAAAVLPVVV